MPARSTRRRSPCRLPRPPVASPSVEILVFARPLLEREYAQRRIPRLAQFTRAPPASRHRSDNRLRYLEDVLPQRQRGPPRHREQSLVRLEHNRVEQCPGVLVLTALAKVRNRHVDGGQSEDDAPRRRQIQQRNFFATA